MSTLALLGLLVVLLVAIGIAGLVLRGRRRRSADPDAPPRTVAELVDRRRDGSEAIDPAVDDADEVSPEADTPALGVRSARTDDDTTAARPGSTGSADEPEPSTEPIAGPAAGSGSTARAAYGTGAGADAASGGDATSETDATQGVDPTSGGDAASGSGATTGADGTAAVDATSGSGATSWSASGSGPGTGGGTDAVSGASIEAADTEDLPETTATGSPAGGDPGRSDGPPTPRPGSDADTGPASPPWSRGFVEGRQIAPPEPVPSEQDEGQEPASGEDSGQPAAGEQSGRPSPPPRQEGRSPVDPDLVKRVTSAPSTGGRRASDPDTERQFREARDRITGPVATRQSRVPEQSSRSPEAAPPPSPGSEQEDDADARSGAAAAVGAGGPAAAAAVTAAVAGSRSSTPEDQGPDDGDTQDAADGSGAVRPSPVPRAAAAPSGPGDEPPPRPSPRVMRSAGPIPSDPDPGDALPADDAAMSTGDAAPDAEDAAPEPNEVAPGVDDAAPEIEDAPFRDDAVSGVESAPEVEDAAPDVDAAPDQAAVADDAPAEEVVAFTGASQAAAGPVPATPAQDVDVRVADRSDRPLAGVALSTVDGSGATAGSGSTGADGGARLRAPGAGHYLLVASAEGYRTGVTPYAVADGPVLVPVTLTRSSTVHGVARTSAGSPRPGVSVSLGQDGQVVARAETGADGAYRFDDLAAGHYQLAAGREPGTTVHVPAETDVEHDVRTVETETV